MGSAFDAAFNQARNARKRGDAGDTFMYNGKSYHSYTKNELDEMKTADYNEIANRLGWKERVTQTRPGKVNDVELSMYSTRNDPATMKNKQLAAMARSESFNEWKGKDPEFMAYLQKQQQENKMYSPEKVTMQGDPELTDDMENIIAQIALTGATMGGGSWLGGSILKGMTRTGGSQLLPSVGGSMKDVPGLSGSLSKIAQKKFEDAMQYGLLQDISKQKYINEIIKYIQ